MVTSSTCLSASACSEKGQPFGKPASRPERYDINVRAPIIATVLLAEIVAIPLMDVVTLKPSNSEDSQLLHVFSDLVDTCSMRQHEARGQTISHRLEDALTLLHRSCQLFWFLQSSDDAVT